MKSLPELADRIGADWVDGPYYADAEKSMDAQWDGLIRPLIADADFSSTLEIAAGHGRNTEKLLTFDGRITAVDINETNVAVLEERFAGNPRVVVLRNNGFDLREVPSGSVSFVYSFDAMVHFDSDVIRAYVTEFARVLKPGGTGFCHYSNNDGNPTGSYREHPGWRNFMSKALFEHWLTKAGLEVVRSHYLMHNLRVVDVNEPNTDAITLFAKSSDAHPSPTVGTVEEPEDRIAKPAHEAFEHQQRIAQLERENAELKRKLGSPAAIIRAMFALRSGPPAAKR